MAKVLIAFGANLGSPQDTLNQTVAALNQLNGLRVQRVSQPWVTRAAGGIAGQPPYTNAVILAESALEPRDLLKILLSIEQQHGRERRPGIRRWQSRPIDLDLLLYDDLILDEPGATIPHPRMSFRRFVLAPAAEVAGEMMHPVSQQSILALLQKIDQKNFFVLLAGSEKNLVQRLLDALENANSEYRFECADRGRLDQKGAVFGNRTRDPDSQIRLPRGLPVKSTIQLRLAEDQAAFDRMRSRARLVVLIRSGMADRQQRVDHWLATVERFAGPLLTINMPQDSDADFESAAQEVIAACQAMEPFPDDRHDSC